jgi:uncharacterized protein YjeT (DUF2065 family)
VFLRAPPRVAAAAAEEAGMQTSVYLARLIGPVFVAVGVGLLVNGQYYRDVIDEALGSHVLIYLSGVLSMLGGLAIVLAHNAWTRGWAVIITVLGWLMVIGGIVRIVVPQVTRSMATTIYSGPTAVIVVAILCIAIGGFLSFKGYVQ